MEQIVKEVQESVTSNGDDGLSQEEQNLVESGKASRKRKQEDAGLGDLISSKKVPQFSPNKSVQAAKKFLDNGKEAVPETTGSGDEEHEVQLTLYVPKKKNGVVPEGGEDEVGGEEEDEDDEEDLEDEDEELDDEECDDEEEDDEEEDSEEDLDEEGADEEGAEEDSEDDK